MTRILLACMALAFVFTSCEPRSQKAAEYNDSIISHQIAISDAFDALDTTFNDYVAEDMDYAHLMLRSKIETGQRVLDTLGNFKNDDVLLKAARELFLFYEDISTAEYIEMINIMKIPDSLYSQEDQESASTVETKIISRFTGAQKEFTDIQVEFGEKYNVLFVEDEEE
ncbi:MAG: hypothetical protein ACI84C_002791 [Flavobacteriales bacterium]|jgi:hypothetical protein